MIDLEGESELKLRSLMDAQMRALELKGYVEIDFMGRAKVNELLHKCIGIGSNCDSYFCQYGQTNQEVHRTYYFIQDEYRFELTHHPETNIYKMQEIYGLHEFMFQVIERFPLVQDRDSHEAAIEEQHLGEWVELSLLEGAVISSIAEIQCRSEEAHIMRELVMLIHEGQMWALQRAPEDQISRITMTLATAIEELCLWLQVE
ncbi:hypothetical protein [Paenibacillus monticola]|nr:hypothetical protein [Paenibacillus monticola]